MFDRYQVVTQKPFEVSSGDCIDGCGDGAICSFCMIYNGGFPRNYFPSRTYPRVVLIDEDVFKKFSCLVNWFSKCGSIT